MSVIIRSPDSKTITIFDTQLVSCDTLNESLKTIVNQIPGALLTSPDYVAHVKKNSDSCSCIFGTGAVITFDSKISKERSEICALISNKLTKDGFKILEPIDVEENL